MDQTTPLATMTALIDARRRGDIEAAVAAYEPAATVLLRPGEAVSGALAIRAFNEGVMILSLAFSDRQAIVADNVALHSVQWSLAAGKGADHRQAGTGLTADVLRRQADGRWLILIDNPWAAASHAPEPFT